MDNAISCPHCGEFIIIEKMNCGIFRHGVLKKSGKQINPHAAKRVCDNYIKKKMIVGCGKPFRIIETKGDITIEVCDYI